MSVINSFEQLAHPNTNRVHFNMEAYSSKWGQFGVRYYNHQMENGFLKSLVSRVVKFLASKNWIIKKINIGNEIDLYLNKRSFKKWEEWKDRGVRRPEWEAVQQQQPAEADAVKRQQQPPAEEEAAGEQVIPQNAPSAEVDAAKTRRVEESVRKRGQRHVQFQLDLRAKAEAEVEKERLEKQEKSRRLEQEQQQQSEVNENNFLLYS